MRASTTGRQGVAIGGGNERRPLTSVFRIVLMSRLPLALTLLLGVVGWAGSVSGEDAPPPPLAPALERLFPALKTEMASLPPFLGDTTLTLHLRTYYLDRTQPNRTENEAWAGGGWLGYGSGRPCTARRLSTRRRTRTGRFCSSRDRRRMSSWGRRMARSATRTMLSSRGTGSSLTRRTSIRRT